MSQTIKVLRGLQANVGALSLSDGELALATDTKNLYIGYSSSKYPVGFWRKEGTYLIYDTASSNVGVGTSSPNEILTAEGRLSLRETTAPSATANYGKIYVKASDSQPYFMDDSGVETALLGGGGGGLSWSKITGNTNAVKDNGYAIVAGAALTLTLPATPSAGDTVGFVDAAGVATTYTLTIARNGEKIFGVAQDLVINTNWSGGILVYVDSTRGWVLVTEVSGVDSAGSTVSKSNSDSPYQALSNQTVMCDVSSAAMTVKLPASPTIGDYVQVKDVSSNASANNITVDRNGNTIEGSAANFVINVDSGSVWFKYMASGDWGIFAIFPVKA